MDALSGRVSTLQFGSNMVILNTPGNVDADDQPGALRDTLERCGRLLAPGTTMRLSPFWSLSTDLVQVALATQQQPVRVHLSSMLWTTFTDELLSAVLRMGSRLALVATLGLQSDQHAGEPWPWGRLRVAGNAHVGMLVRLPCGGPASPFIHCEWIEITCPLQEVSQGTCYELHTCRF